MTRTNVAGSGDPVATDPLPLSFTQERIWFEEQIRRNTPTYHVPMIVRVSGSLDLVALQQAVDTVVARHHALRTVFTDTNGTPQQMVLPEVRVPVTEQDLRTLPDAATAGEDASLREVRLPFDLGRGPLLRVAVLRIADREYLLVVTVHHLCFDGSSFTPFFAELSAAYNAALSGLAPKLNAPRRQFTDAVRSERKELTPDAINGLLDWWRGYLADAPDMSELPPDQPASERRGHTGGQRRLLLDPEASAGVRDLGREHGATPFMTLLSAFAVVLSRQTHQTSLLVGTPVSTRQVADYQAVGCYLNTLTLRLDLDGNPSFAELLGRVRHGALDAFTHQRLPFQLLVKDRAQVHGRARNPLFQVFFNVLPPVPELKLQGCTAQQLPMPDTGNKFDLTLYASVQGDQWALEAVYDADLYVADRIDDLLEQIASVLRQALDAPERPVADFALATCKAVALTPDPTIELHATATGSLLERLLRHATEHPDRPALTGPSGTWTYRELADHTERLACRLADLGVGSGDVVAVQGVRDPAVVVALLATVRAGAAFAVFDTALPAAELAARAEQVRPKAWIESVPGQMAWTDASGPVVAMNDEGESLTGTTVPSVSDLAYVSFTSGSTGRPRAILGTHGPLAHFLDWYTRTFAIGPSDRFSVLSGLGHDPFLRDVLAPVWAGATAVFPEADLRDTAALAEMLGRQEITVAHLTPALADALGDAAVAAGISGWPTLRLVGFGGDALQRRTVREWAALAPGADLLNMYGTTETPQAVSVHMARRGGETVRTGVGLVPLGPGIDEVQLLVLAGDRPAAIGEIGELVVRSPHLARYADSSDNGGFTTNPLTDSETDLVYRTGDLARLRPDGLFDCLGRADLQVKVRGFRVETAEIEAAAAAYPNVKQAVVIPEPQPRGGHRLVCYLATGEVRPDLARLRAALAEQLADYKIPAAYVVVDAFPLTANRKIDRAALRGLGRQESAADANEYMAPAGGIEEMLAALWQEVLGQEGIGSRDNFFALGGHSLLLNQILVRIRRTLQVQLSLRELFDHPTIGALAGLIERSVASTPEQPILHVDESEPAPLSWTQERLWLEDQLRPSDAAYNMPTVLRLRGPLDVNALQEALDSVVRRHSVLRSRFVLVQGAPVQQAVADARVPLRHIDLRGHADTALQEAMRETKRPFDLAAGSPFRGLLIRTAAEEHLLVLTAHHIVFDGWSFAVLLDHLSRAYRTLLDGGSADLGAGLQFSDVARWQRAGLEGQPLTELLAWWSRELEDIPAVLELPTDRPRPAIQAHQGARHRLVIESSLAKQVRRLSRDAGSTLFMTLLSAFGVILSRYTGQDRLLVGSPVANRERAEFEDLVGCFLNTVPIPLDLTGDPGFTDVVARTTDSALAAFAHQQVPFGMLVNEFVPDRDLSRSPLVQVLFALQSVRLGTFEAPGLISEQVEVSEANVQFDLNLRMSDTGDEIIGWLDYDTDLFDAATIDRMAGHFTNLLAAVSAEPLTCVTTVDLLSQTERALVVHEWNSTRAAYPDLTLTSLLEEQARREDSRIAVRCGNDQLDWTGLHRRANWLAWKLRELGVGPDVVVAIHMERSVELVVALLAVLKAGGAYLPLDPGYPRERLEFMLTDSQAHVLLTGPGTHAYGLATDGSIRVVAVGPDPGAGRDDQPPESPVSSDHLAYVIYTSGSTGRPKGVQVPHRGIVNRLLWMQEAFRLEPGDVVLQKTPTSFDVSVWELFWPLITGARMVLAEPGGHRDPDYLARLIQHEHVSVCHFVPPMLDLFLSAPPAAQCRSLRLVVCSGEALPVELALKFHRTLPAKLENLYGPTETSVDVTRWSSRPDWAGQSVPVGAPIANTQVYVLDGRMTPTPIGVPGELHVGGAQLARAYGGRPDTTADRFVPDPFSAPGARLYRTGDLARWRSDGTLEYLGRIDSQVKVRGFRIELGEIETALTRQPGVGQAVVVVREDEPGDPRIVAYLTADAGGAPDQTGLRRALGKTLPEHMLPSAFVVLDTLPTGLNGKLDRRSLPVPKHHRPLDAGHTAPRTDTERRLVGLWQRVLREEHVSLTDSFFELGGDSMHAVRLVGLAREHGLDFALTELFTHPTVESLAAWLASTTVAGQKSATSAVKKQMPLAAFGLLSPEDFAKLPGHASENER
ncbi:amino acid adenylation domain-containing protein [Streptomyces sp. NPDC021356]|uniref:amino acid adenylation domain-containing protein n=1 Tax=Streptomyces sp. NPDC021356 TaxID=3154900 RepID=UPI0033E6EC9C